jgi:hypothetical protein
VTLEWSVLDTGTHQDHVIAHVMGTTVVGYFIADEAAHLLLDIGFIWTIYLDTEMGLLPQSVLIGELPLDAAAKAELLADATLLQDGGAASGPKRMVQVAALCLITEVTCYAQDERRRVLIGGEDSSLIVETSLANAQLRVMPVALTP